MTNQSTEEYKKLVQAAETNPNKLGLDQEKLVAVVEELQDSNAIDYKNILDLKTKKENKELKTLSEYERLLDQTIQNFALQQSGNQTAYTAWAIGIAFPYSGKNIELYNLLANSTQAESVGYPQMLDLVKKIKETHETNKQPYTPRELIALRIALPIIMDPKKINPGEFNTINNEKDRIEKEALETIKNAGIKSQSGHEYKHYNGLSGDYFNGRITDPEVLEKAEAIIRETEKAIGTEILKQQTLVVKQILALGFSIDEYMEIITGMTYNQITQYTNLTSSKQPYPDRVEYYERLAMHSLDHLPSDENPISKAKSILTQFGIPAESIEEFVLFAIQNHEIQNGGHSFIPTGIATSEVKGLENYPTANIPLWSLAQGKKIAIYTPEPKNPNAERLTYHEAGHALEALLLLNPEVPVGTLDRQAAEALWGRPVMHAEIMGQFFELYMSKPDYTIKKMQVFLRRYNAIAKHELQMWTELESYAKGKITLDQLVQNAETSYERSMSSELNTSVIAQRFRDGLTELGKPFWGSAIYAFAMPIAFKMYSDTKNLNPDAKAKYIKDIATQINNAQNLEEFLKHRNWDFETLVREFEEAANRIPTATQPKENPLK